MDTIVKKIAEVRDKAKNASSLTSDQVSDFISTISSLEVELNQMMINQMVENSTIIAEMVNKAASSEAKASKAKAKKVAVK